MPGPARVRQEIKESIGTPAAYTDEQWRLCLYRLAPSWGIVSRSQARRSGGIEPSHRRLQRGDLASSSHATAANSDESEVLSAQGPAQVRAPASRHRRLSPTRQTPQGESPIGLEMAARLRPKPPPAQRMPQHPRHPATHRPRFSMFPSHAFTSAASSIAHPEAQ